MSSIVVFLARADHRSKWTGPTKTDTEIAQKPRPRPNVFGLVQEGKMVGF